MQTVLSGIKLHQELSIHYELDPALPPAIVSDQLRLQQILLNLASNAIKFTPKGEVRISMSCIAIEENHCRIRFSVSDTGIGISPDQQSKIFEDFMQAEISTTRRFGGTGLGLTICKRLVELLGGELKLESTLNLGSCFWFELDLESSNKTDIASCVESDSDYRISKPLTNIEILLVDDVELNLEIASELLREAGARVTTASGGLEAVTKTVNGSKSFDVILMDIQMPDLDGFEASRRIRADSRFIHMPIIAMTANASNSDRNECLAAGLNDHLGKPIDINQVITTILQHLK